jgi:hypothetical protein
MKAFFDGETSLFLPTGLCAQRLDSDDANRLQDRLQPNFALCPIWYEYVPVRYADYDRNLILGSATAVEKRSLGSLSDRIEFFVVRFHVAHDGSYEYVACVNEGGPARVKYCRRAQRTEIDSTILKKANYESAGFDDEGEPLWKKLASDQENARTRAMQFWGDEAQVRFLSSCCLIISFCFRYIYYNLIAGRVQAGLGHEEDSEDDIEESVTRAIQDEVEKMKGTVPSYLRIELYSYATPL